MKNLKRERKNSGQKNTSFFSEWDSKSKQSNMLKYNYIADYFIVREF
jgi:hypothetical protein